MSARKKLPPVRKPVAPELMDQFHTWQAEGARLYYKMKAAERKAEAARDTAYQTLQTARLAVAALDRATVDIREDDKQDGEDDDDC